MGAARILLILGTVSTAYLAFKVHRVLFSVPPLPELEETWWGPKGDVDTAIRPFKINISEEVVKDLKHRLKIARPFVPPLEGAQHHYGINTKFFAEFVDFWKEKYDWKGREHFLNQFPQYKVNVQGLDIHYIHVKPDAPSGVKVLPLLLLHGWPGSVREFYEIIPILTRPTRERDYVFEVIAPSLPGYGFSSAAVKPGLGATEMAVVFKNLMARLGFQKFYAQGGDWGSVLVSNLATLFPQHLLGVHSNMCFVNSPLATTMLLLGSFYPPLIVEKEHEHKVYPYSSFLKRTILETGYMHLQATKPDTIGVALNDSPVGLAAYILEKFITWTNPDGKNLYDGALLKKYEYTALLDNIMIYWVTGTITTSMRIYAEVFNVKQTSQELPSIPTEVPAACAKFSYDLAWQPDAILRLKYKNLVHTASYEAGHFAAFEEPEVLAEDIFLATDKFLEL